MRRILIGLGLLFISFTSGCFWVLDDSPSMQSFTYVLNIGNIEQITNWTLKQDDWRKRMNGGDALLYLMADKDVFSNRNRVSFRKALAGYEVIVRSREDIAPETTIGYDQDSHNSIKALSEMSFYYSEVRFFNFDLDELTTIYMAIKPKSKYGEYMALWQKEMDDINEMKSRKTPSK